MKELLDFAVELAERAGEITLEYFRKDIQVEIKPDHSPVTIADRLAEEMIRREIEKRFPQDGILGEEFGEKAGTSGYRWILDPIDGTKSFIRGIAMYGAMIAVEKDGESRIGVIRFPPSRETVSALRGHGCFCNGERCKVSDVDSPAQAMIVASSFNDIIKHQSEASLLRLLKETGLQRTWGDCYGYYLVADGRVEAAIDARMHVWDVAPFLPIIEEAGGRVTDVYGNEPSLAMTSMLASNGKIHDTLVSFFRE
ncbi:MAG: inositol monophosphatase family protein [Candidatus Omnitrophota bacterium]|jgi:histidinol phosphatase-like enzyme (inositol monophosphatase family)|nr:MAG: inositol monophosphatase family protein [Candidatus Omnitrophota bacterium]